MTVPVRTPDASGYVTRGEFMQFERRMDERFTSLGRKVDAVHATVTEVVEADEQGEWLGPRAWHAMRILGPAAIGGGIAYLIAYLT